MTRRSVLQRGIAASALMLGSSISVAGCSAGTQPPPTGGEVAAILPAYLPSSIEPDLPGDNDAVPGGFLSYPADPQQLITTTPGRGGTVTAMVELAIAPGNPSGNSFWRSLDERLGTHLDIAGAPAGGDYEAKFATTLAGNDLPDVVQIPFGYTNRLPQILETKFADLTDYLTGDAIRELPMLAGIPSYSWEHTLFNGRIYAVPYAAAKVGQIMAVRADIVAQEGLSTSIGSRSDLHDLMVGLTDARRDRWSCANPQGMLTFVKQMAGVPNGWQRTDDGTFHHAAEAEQYLEALSTVAQWWKEGLFHPGSYGTTKQVVPWFVSGAAPMAYLGYSTWSSLYRVDKVSTPELEVTVLDPPKLDGGGMAGRYLGTGIYTITAVRKADPDRVREILGIMNMLAAPFGSAEYLLNKYGVEGQHFTMKDGNPVLTETGKTETGIPWPYIAQAPPVFYDGGFPEVTKAQHEFFLRTVPRGVSDDSVGLLSETAGTKGLIATKRLTALEDDIIKGRADVNQWTTGVASWRSEVGDTIRREYETAYEQRHH